MLKQNVAHRVSPGVRFWQPRYYDFNVWSAEKRVEKLKYMHLRGTPKARIGGEA